jgi:MEDS: MEthanogen/methylotroph, DcmR Sensory domain
MQIADRGHAVQFYHADRQLLQMLTRYVGTALVTGDVAVVIASKAHRLMLDRRLASRGLSVNMPRQAGRYVALDAETILAKFMRDGVVDERAAREVIGDVLRRAAAVPSAESGPARLFAFGEMVAVLFADGKPEQAMVLEEIWNDLARDHAFTLCCAYPMNAFEARHAASFMRICAQHSHVFPASTPPPTSLSA